MISNLSSEIIGVKNDSWSERRRAWRREPQGTATCRRQQKEKSLEESREMLGEAWREAR